MRTFFSLTDNSSKKNIPHPPKHPHRPLSIRCSTFFCKHQQLVNDFKNLLLTDNKAKQQNEKFYPLIYQTDTNLRDLYPASIPPFCSELDSSTFLLGGIGYFVYLIFNAVSKEKLQISQKKT